MDERSQEEIGVVGPVIGADVAQERHVRRQGLDRGSICELREYRELFHFLAWRDVKVRYKQTPLGALRAINQPLFTMVVFTLLFGPLANMPSGGVPHPVFYFSALVPRTYFSSTIADAGMSLVGNAGLLTKICFPRVILRASPALSGIVPNKNLEYSLCFSNQRDKNRFTKVTCFRF
jgi:hypothetical protein